MTKFICHQVTASWGDKQVEIKNRKFKADFKGVVTDEDWYGLPEIEYVLKKSVTNYRAIKDLKLYFLINQWVDVGFGDRETLSPPMLVDAHLSGFFNIHSIEANSSGVFKVSICSPYDGNGFTAFSVPESKIEDLSLDGRTHIWTKVFYMPSQHILTDKLAAGIRGFGIHILRSELIKYCEENAISDFKNRLDHIDRSYRYTALESLTDTSHLVGISNSESELVAAVNSLKSKKQTNTDSGYQHTSEYLEAMDHMIAELITPDTFPTNDLMNAWLKEKYPDFSDTEIKSIRTVVRPKKLKGK